jgi:CRISPR system Cascade subunit CasE
MSELWLSRIALRQAAPVAALARLLVPNEAGEQNGAAHRLVWALFTDGEGRRRDFLWRQERPGAFMALSARPPVPMDDVFEVQSQEFAPNLVGGDRLRFSLRANPVVARSAGPGQRGKRHDVVMDAIRTLPECCCKHPGLMPREICPLDYKCRAQQRMALGTEAGRRWLASQGERGGFKPLGEVGVDGYETLRIPRGEGPPVQYSVLDFEGVLEVTDPSRFLVMLAQGFGRAKAFGCGMMLIRRAL